MLAKLSHPLAAPRPHWPRPCVAQTDRKCLPRPPAPPNSHAQRSHARCCTNAVFSMSWAAAAPHRDTDESLRSHADQTALPMYTPPSALPPRFALTCQPLPTSSAACTNSPVVRGFPPPENASPTRPGRVIRETGAASNTWGARALRPECSKTRCGKKALLRPRQRPLRFPLAQPLLPPHPTPGGEAGGEPGAGGRWGIIILRICKQRQCQSEIHYF